MKKLIVLIAVLLISSQAYADDITFTWANYTDQTIDGFKLKDHEHHVLINNIPKTATSVSIEEPNDCETYYLTAYKGDLESGASTIVPYCTKPDVIMIPSTFNITITPN